MNDRWRVGQRRNRRRRGGQHRRDGGRRSLTEIRVKLPSRDRDEHDCDETAGHRDQKGTGSGRSEDEKERSRCAAERRRIRPRLREPHRSLEADERSRLVAELIGERRNRRHKPGRGFEALRYRFEVTSDYGAFRDLQRHRLLTCQWQRLGCELGADVPEEVEAAGFGDSYRRGLAISRAQWERLRGEGLIEESAYAVSLAYRIRYVLDMNAREAMHLIELRAEIAAPPL